MNYQSVARRYLPLAAVVAVQLLIIAVVPSKGAPGGSTAVASGPVQGFSTGGASTGLSSGASTGLSNGATGPASGAGSVPGAAGGASGSTGGPSGGSAAGGTGGSAAPGGTGGGSAGGGGGGVSAAGSRLDTSHCAGNREFSPTIDFYAPPCTPGPVGGSFANGGATAQGVTANSVTIVDYVSNYGAEVNTILQAQGLLETYQNALVVDKAWQNFINAHYVLWGRKLIIKTYQGQCQSVPPDTNCLLPEMDTVVKTYHPYAVFWNTTLCSACFARLAADGVVAVGGVGFSDAFAQANAPYFYSAFESSTQIETAFAHWYCAQMAGKDAVFAPDKNPAQNFSHSPRVLGVISTNDPDNEDTVNHVLVPLLKQTCGVAVSHFYFYDQNINTAAQQVEAGISAMDTPSNPATTVLCLCDPVAPEFLYEGEQQHNYWPENVLADVQGMGYDSAAQNYDSPPVSCPQPSIGCNFDDALGLLASDPQESQDNNSGVRTFKAGGGTTMPITGLTAWEVWQDYNMLASLIENTGPDLTAARMAAAAPSMGSIGGGTSGHTMVGFTPNHFNWQQDARVAYWSRNTPSSYNGKPGAYVSIEGSRFLPTQYPNLPEPPVPASR